MPMFRKQLLEKTSRGRIVGMLKRGGLTAEEIAAELAVTAAAVRAHLTAMERDAIVQRTGQRAGPTRPSQVFELTPEVEQLLSGAYVPLLIELVRQSAMRVTPKELVKLMRRTGQGLAAAFPQSVRPESSLAARVHSVSRLMNEQFGSTMKVESANKHHILRGYGCPLAALTGNHPTVCTAIESMIATLLQANVQECCDRAQRPRCCFHIAESKPAPPS
jgi:DeoR family transcriptional regulator, suf operon transcriptional repressor